jgi:hypothetical protein
MSLRLGQPVLKIYPKPKAEELGVHLVSQSAEEHIILLLIGNRLNTKNAAGCILNRHTAELLLLIDIFMIQLPKDLLNCEACSENKIKRHFEN